MKSDAPRLLLEFGDDGRFTRLGQDLMAFLHIQSEMEGRPLNAGMGRQMW